MEKLRYAIIGTGAVGGYYGGLLARSGADVHFLARSDFQHIQTFGLRVDSKDGDFLLPQLHVYDSVDAMPVCDVVVIALKSTQNSLLTEILPPLVHAGTYVVVLQNGLHVESIADDVMNRICGESRVFGGCCFLCSNKVAPGHIRHLDYGRIAIGAYVPSSATSCKSDQSKPSPMFQLGDSTELASPEELGSKSNRVEGNAVQHEKVLNTIVNDFRNARITIDVTEDLATARWNKLSWNIPYNGLSVILNASTADLMQNPSGRSVVFNIMKDVQRAALACGSMVTDGHLEKMLRDTEIMVPYDSSMRLDYLAHRPMEIEAIVGNPMRASQAAGYPAPLIEAVYHQLKYLSSHVND